MIVLLRGGVISHVRRQQQVTDRLFVAGGFAEITPERCTVLADEAIPVSDLSKADAEQRVTAAQKAYDETDKMDIAALDAAMDRLQSARAMVTAAGG